MYDSMEDGRYEFDVLREVQAANPTVFTVPKALLLVEGEKHVMLVLEYVKGNELQACIDRFLVFKDRSALQTFNLLGKAFREFHNLPLRGLRESGYPSSEEEIDEEVKGLSDRLHDVNILRDDCTAVLGNLALDKRLLKTVNLMGEGYHTHILMSGGKFVFLDLHKACKGPAFYDLATFDVSLYGSLLLPAMDVASLEPLVNAFLQGYFERDIPFESIKIAELYVTLQALNDMMSNSYSLRNRFVTLLKIKRFRKIVKEAFAY